MLNQPGNDSLRRLVIERAKSLTGQVRSLSSQMESLTANLNSEIQNVATEVNRLTDKLAKLNQRIVQMEGGRTVGSDAVGLRDERLQVLNDLASYVDIRAVEQQSGSVTVYVGGEYLVADGIQRPVTYAISQAGGETRPEVRLADTDSPLLVSSGRLKGLYDARDGAASRTAADLDTFATNLIEQFNRIHTQGQGLDGYQTLTTDNSADDISAPVDLAGYGTK